MREPGKKPLSKRFHGDGAERYVHIAMKQLARLYAVDAPVLTNRITVDNANIYVQKLIAMDIITITISAGYVAAMRFRLSYDYGSQQATGEIINTEVDVALFWRGQRLSGTWVPTGTYRPSTIGGDSTLLPWKGKGLDAEYQGGDGGGITAWGVTSDLASSFQLELGIEDDLATADVQFPHYTHPFVRGGVRGFFFLTRDDGVNYIGVKMEDKDDFTRFAFIPPFTPVRGLFPRFTLIAPFILVGYAGDGVNPAYFFVFELNEDGVTGEFEFFNANSYLTAHPLGSNLGVLLVPITYSTALFTAATGTYNTGGEELMEVWHIDFSDGSTTLVLSDPALATGFQIINAGNGAIVIIRPSAIAFDDALTPIGWYSIRFLSLDNGQTWASAPAQLPQSTNNGNVSLNIGELLTIVPFEPYVNDDNQGALYVLSTVDDSGYNRTPVQICKSTDLAATWTIVGTAASIDSLPLDYPTSDVNAGQTAYPVEAFLVGIGTTGSPLPIDAVNPWRCDDSVTESDFWIQ